MKMARLLEMKVTDVPLFNGEVAYQYLKQPMPISAFDGEMNFIEGYGTEEIQHRYLPVADFFQNVPEYESDAFDAIGWHKLEEQNPMSNHATYHTAIAMTPETEHLLRLPMQSLLDDLANAQSNSTNEKKKREKAENDLEDAINALDEYKSLGLFQKIIRHFKKQ